MNLLKPAAKAAGCAGPGRFGGVFSRVFQLSSDGSDRQSESKYGKNGREGKLEWAFCGELRHCGPACGDPSSGGIKPPCEVPRWVDAFGRGDA